MVDHFRAVGIEALEDLLKGIARAVFLSDSLGEAEEGADALVAAARLDHLSARQQPIAICVNVPERLIKLLLICLRGHRSRNHLVDIRPPSWIARAP
jgi:hypothetical protein